MCIRQLDQNRTESWPQVAISNGSQSQDNKNYSSCPNVLLGQGDTDWIKSELKGHFWLVSTQTPQQHSRASQTNDYTANLGVSIRQIIQSPLHLLRLHCSRLDKQAEFTTEYWASLQLCNG